MRSKGSSLISGRVWLTAKRLRPGLDPDQAVSCLRLTQLNIKLGEVLNRLDAVERENHLLHAKLMELERELKCTGPARGAFNMPSMTRRSSSGSDVANWSVVHDAANDSD